MKFKSRAVRALVTLQMEELRSLLKVWRKAKRLGVALPATRDPAYVSLDRLMFHPLRSSRGYLLWLCKVLGRPDPQVAEPPEPVKVGARAGAYIEDLERAWEKHMAWMTDAVVRSKRVHTSNWGHPMTVESMFEHALAHPMRHRLQLENLIASE